MIAVTRAQVAAFRMAAQFLDRRLDRSVLGRVAAGGVQNSPPGTAALAFAARLDGLAPDAVATALTGDRSLLQLWSLRAAPYVVPTGDAAVFTTGLLPDDEASRLFFMRGATAHLGLFGLTASEAVALVAAVLPAVLDGRPLTKDELGVALAAEVGRALPRSRRALWDEPDGLGRNTHGESLARYALAVVSLHGGICLVPGEGRGAVRIARVDQWLAAAPPAMEPAAARAELARRYLRWFGPSTAAEFAAWAGAAPGFARASWGLVAGELAAVDYAGRAAWALAADVPLLREPPMAAGARWLPPHDPFLALPDRAALVADPALRRRVWRTVGNPGVVLVDGAAAATWRPRTRGRRLTLLVEPLGPPLPARARRAVEREAAAVARALGTADPEVRFA